MLPLPAQLHALVVTALTGLAVGLLFDAYRLVRRLLFPKGRGSDALDGAFAASAGLLVGSGLLLAGWGELRHYALLGGVLGLAAYFWLGSATVLWAGERLLRRWTSFLSRQRARAARARSRLGGAAARVGRWLSRALRFPLAPLLGRRKN